LLEKSGQINIITRPQVNKEIRLGVLDGKKLRPVHPGEILLEEFMKP